MSYHEGSREINAAARPGPVVEDVRASLNPISAYATPNRLDRTPELPLANSYRESPILRPPAI